VDDPANTGAMSKIVVKVEDVTRLVDIMPTIRKITGLGISEAKLRIESGQPLVEFLLYYNDHDEIARRLRVLMTALPQLGARLRLFELDEGEEFEALPNASAYEISSDVLGNILLLHERGLERWLNADEDEL
jgi:hypothetical protein